MPIMLRFIFLFSFFSSTYLSRNSFTAAFILNVLQNELLKALKFENSNKLYTLAYISINENHFQNPYPALLYWWRERLGDNVGILWILGNIRQYCRCCYSNFEIWIRLRFWFLPKLLYQKFIGAFIHPHIIAQCAMMATKCAKIHQEVLFLWLLWRKKNVHSGFWCNHCFAIALYTCFFSALCNRKLPYPNASFSCTIFPWFDFTVFRWHEEPIPGSIVTRWERATLKKQNCKYSWLC